jgi:hypothetical protein
LFVRTQTNGSRTYLPIVDNVRVDGKIKQRVLHRLGRLDELLASGQLDSLVHSLGRFSARRVVLGAHAQGDGITTHSARIGPALLFQRLWQSRSIDAVLTALLKHRRFEFPVERAIFLTVLHRLFAPGSDRAADQWKDDYAIQGASELDLHHLYRAIAWLGEPLAKDQQDGATSRASAQMLGYAGDVLLPTQTIGQIIDLIDSGAVLLAGETPERKLEWIVNSLEVPCSAYPKSAGRNYSLLYGGRQGSGMTCTSFTFYLEFKDGIAALPMRLAIPQSSGPLTYEDGK